MIKLQVNRCGCPACQSPYNHPDKDLHRMMNLLISCMNPRQRRWYAALEAIRLGRGGISRVALITGLDRKTIRRGIYELKKEDAT